MSDAVVQTRSEETGIKVFVTLKEAFEAAEEDPTIWKVSFTWDEERVRLVRQEYPNGKTKWVYSDLLSEVATVQEALDENHKLPEGESDDVPWGKYGPRGKAYGRQYP